MKKICFTLFTAKILFFLTISIPSFSQAHSPFPQVRSYDFLWGHYRQMIQEGPTQFLERMALEYRGQEGRPILISLGPFKTLYVISNPLDVKEIVSDQHRAQLKKGYSAKTLSDYLLGKGVAVLETGDIYDQIKGHMHRYLLPSGIRPYLEEMKENTSRFIHQLQEKRQISLEHTRLIDMHQEITGFAIRGISQSMFQFEIPYTREGDLKVTQITESIKTILSYIAQKLILPFPIPSFLDQGYSRYLQARSHLSEIIEEIIVHDETHEYSQNTLIRELRSLTEQETIDQVTSIFFAGQDTTSHLLTMAVYRLSTEPFIRERLLQELKVKLGESLEVENTEQLSRNHLPYLDAFINEVLRMDSPIPGIGRDVVEDLELRGFHIPRGSTLYVSLNAIHRLPEYWNNPDEFNPDRFLSQTTSETQMGRNFIPFGGGKRKCMGEFFAKQEAKVFLIGFLASGILLENIQAPLPVFSCSMKLKDGLVMKFLPNSHSP